MAGRRRAGAAFRPDPGEPSARRPSRTQSAALLLTLLLVAGVVAAVSYAVRPTKARAFDLFYGSVLLDDDNGPVSVDLATATPTIRLVDAAKLVGADTESDLDIVPLSGGSLLLDSGTGTFNMVDATGFVVQDRRVTLPSAGGTGSASAVPDGAQAYILTSGADGTHVYLVNQSTVQAAHGTSGVTPRAAAAMPETVSGQPGSAVSADGDLWVLAGTTLRRLTVPAGSNPGVTLGSTDFGTVAGPAALGAATANSDGSGPDVVALATPSRIELIGPGASTRSVALTGLAGVDRILPATNQTGRFSFLFHSAAGWSQASVDPTGGDLVGPLALPSVPASADLAEPAASAGALYTIDRAGNGQLWQITRRTAVAVPDATQYPVETGDPSTFTDATVYARGSRVLFNSPSHHDALALFTDNTHSPVRIAKSSALGLSSGAGASAQILGHETTSPKAKSGLTPAKVAPAAQTPVDNSIDCKTTAQVPHAPTIAQAEPGSRSVAVFWSYPQLGPQDCEPSTYVVAVRALTPQAPSPPGAVTVQGQTGVTLGGLFPDTEYELTVTAYINGTGTASAPIQITTEPEGPAAPTGLAVRFSAGSGWTVDWNSCGGISQGCVPSTAWTVVPSFCDGLGLSSPPAALGVVGDPTSHSFTTTLPAAGALLGRGLSFRVQGVGPAGTEGTLSGASPCVRSWGAPVAGAFTLSATAPPTAQFGGTTTTTVTLRDTGGDAVVDAGGIGATYSIHLVPSASAAQSGTVKAGAMTASFTIDPGTRYTAVATLTAPNGGSSVTLPPVPVTVATSSWPTDLAAALSYADTSNTQGSLSITFSGLTSSQADGESFDVTGTFTCGSAQFPLDKSGVDLTTALSYPVDRTNYYGTCTASALTLAEDPASVNGTPLFGGTKSVPPSPASVTINPPSLGGVSAGDFSAAWDGTHGADSQLAVQYSGANLLLPLAGRSWSVKVTDPHGTACGTSGPQDGSIPDVVIDPACVTEDGASTTGWTIVVNGTFFGTPIGPVTLTRLGNGPAPTYAPPVCDFSQLAAAWAGSAAGTTPATQLQVKISVADATQIANCSGWSFTVDGPTTDHCGSANGNPPTAITVDTSTCSADLTASGWTVAVTYTDQGGHAQNKTLALDGAPPP